MAKRKKKDGSPQTVVIRQTTGTKPEIEISTNNALLILRKDAKNWEVIGNWEFKNNELVRIESKKDNTES